ERHAARRREVPAGKREGGGRGPEIRRGDGIEGSGRRLPPRRRAARGPVARIQAAHADPHAYRDDQEVGGGARNGLPCEASVPERPGTVPATTSCIGRWKGSRPNTRSRTATSS